MAIFKYIITILLLITLCACYYVSKQFETYQLEMECQQAIQTTVGKCNQAIEQNYFKGLKDGQKSCI
jgi:hypothetical protein